MMKLRNIAFVLGLSVVAACGRTNDVPAMQKEALSIAKSYSARFDALAVRAESMRARGRLLKGTYAGAEEASTNLSNLMRQIGTLRADAAKAPSDIENAATISRDDLSRTRDEMDQRFDREWTESNAALNAIGEWMARSERSDATAVALLSAPTVPSAIAPSEHPTPVLPPAPAPSPTPSGTRQPATPGTPAAPAPAVVPGNQ